MIDQKQMVRAELWIFRVMFYEFAAGPLLFVVVAHSIHSATVLKYLQNNIYIFPFIMDTCRFAYCSINAIIVLYLYQVAIFVLIFFAGVRIASIPVFLTIAVQNKMDLWYGRDAISRMNDRFKKFPFGFGGGLVCIGLIVWGIFNAVTHINSQLNEPILQIIFIHSSILFFALQLFLISFALFLVYGCVFMLAVLSLNSLAMHNRTG